MNGVTEAQYGYLTQGLHQSRIRHLDGNSHLEAWDVRRTLIRVFGYGGWNVETIALDLVREIESPPGTLKRRNGSTNDRTVWTVVYRAQVRLTVKDAQGREIARYEDAASGDAVNQPSLGDAHDLAMKASLSQALKRCAVNLGDQFGLALYNGGKADPVVVRSLVSPVAGDVAPSPDDAPAVVGGELDKQAPADASAQVSPALLLNAIGEAADAAGVPRSHVAQRWESDHDQSIKDATDVDGLAKVLAELRALVKTGAAS
ncbi:Rad52/Rad22 family DNA repair protein [uncultured Nocardioides sp.]|jgi:hypothetical protein|uniref:Rad52/Rad22 family DNA repair protein n=1 Tax=uncultured Nocardioides sp. TaxID=198441 RepID=UPI00261E2BD7|nr:Rad52/Rad22 family DNA repair protein [uncultured Nocardioides sp.]